MPDPVDLKSVCPVTVPINSKSGPATRAATPGAAVTAPMTGPFFRHRSYLKTPVAGSSARKLPLHVLPLMVVFPPATKSVVPFQALEEILPSPHCGHSPPTAIVAVQIGPLL